MAVSEDLTHSDTLMTDTRRLNTAGMKFSHRTCKAWV